MTYKMYRGILFWISLAIFAVSLGAVLSAAVRIYPAFGFIGVLSAEDKLGLMKKTSVYICVGTACLLFTAPEQRKFSCHTIISAVISALLLPLGIFLYSFQPAYVTSYQIAAICFFIIPFTMTSAASDFIPVIKRNKINVYYAISTFCGAIIILISSLTAMYLILKSVMLLPVILYTMFPFVIFTNIIVLLNRFTRLLSLRTAIILYSNAAVMPVCGIFLTYNTEIAVYTGGCMLTAETILSLISTIYDIRRVYYGKHKHDR